ncbi:MAG: hypothetical protein ABFC96_12755 [Thermoguttaceae bacterium]
MMRRLIAIVIVAVLAAGAYGVYSLWWHSNYCKVERTDYKPPAERDEPQLSDDSLDERHPTFDAALVDSRPLREWEVNASAAVVRLDCPMIKPDVEGDMLRLRPSYAEAIQAARPLLPSASMLDGAAKQFDDGLYAAMDLACFRGELGFAPAAPDWVATVFQRLPPQSPARPFLAAALELAGKKVQVSRNETDERDRLLADFEQDQTASKPIGFYDWTPELKRVWRFYRFLQREFDQDHLAIPRDVAAVLKGDSKLLEQYRAINGFYGRLTAPLVCLPVDSLVGVHQNLAELAKQHGARHSMVAIFPPSTSRETELFERLFPFGLPGNVNLMTELIRRVRSGEVELKPGESDGWYQYQVYALETLLLPNKGQEKDRLQLTAQYKRRLVEAFKAMITKRRETHVRQTFKCAAQSLGPSGVSPRLRIEPCATFYLRTARAYAFVQAFLRATAGGERLIRLHGLKQGGRRPKTLDAELEATRQRFYGFYLIACEDLGMKPQLLDGEPVDRSAAKQTALKWLKSLDANQDLACDTRVSAPIYVDQAGRNTRIWATLGVRLAYVNASYARPPQVRPKAEGGPWKEVESWQLGESRYVIAVDESAEIELSGLRSLTRDELRAACDRYGTKEEILRGFGR